MLPLRKRRVLARLLKRTKSDTLRFSEAFEDPTALLAACHEHGLEGIVSKLRNDRYRSGRTAAGSRSRGGLA